MFGGTTNRFKSLVHQMVLRYGDRAQEQIPHPLLDALFAPFGKGQ